MESNPQVPNPEQLQFIHPKANPQNPARYETAPEQLTPPVPVVTLGPNAIYLVQPGYWDEKVEGVKPPDEAKAPILSSIDPDELPVWAADTEVQFVGENFVEGASAIIWNGSAEPTTFVDSEHLATIVKPSTVSLPPPVTIPAWVVVSGKETEHLEFTFIA